MKIAISGVQCTGKSTLLDALEKTEELRGYTFIREVVRGMKGITINEFGDDASQLAIANAHVRNLSIKNMVTDRCIMDCYAYGKYCYAHGTVSSKVIDKVRSIYNRSISKYDLICYIKPEFALTSDGVRSVNVAFRDESLVYFNNLVRNLINHHGNVVIVSGTVPERVDAFLNAYFDVLKYGYVRPENAGTNK